MMGPAPVRARCCSPRVIWPMAVSGDRPARSACTSASSRLRVPVSGIEPVALLGDGQRHDPDGRCGDPFHHCFRVVPTGDGFQQAGDHADRSGALAPLGHGEQAVLRRQLPGHGVRPLGDTDDPPVGAAGGPHGVLGEDCSVGTGKGAKAQVDDSWLQVFAVQGNFVAGCSPARQVSGVRWCCPFQAVRRHGHGSARSPG